MLANPVCNAPTDVQTGATESKYMCIMSMCSDVTEL